MVRDPQALEARLLGHARLTEELGGAELLAGQEVADPHAAAATPAAAGAAAAHKSAPGPRPTETSTVPALPSALPRSGTGSTSSRKYVSTSASRAPPATMLGIAVGSSSEEIGPLPSAASPVTTETSPT